MKFAFIHTQLATPQKPYNRTGVLSPSAAFWVFRAAVMSAWKRRQKQPLSAQQQAKQQAEGCLRLQIRAAHRRGRCYYGSPRVQDELRDQGIHVSRKRVARLMREEGLVGRSRARRRVQTTDSRHNHRVADNLLERRFAPQEVARPNRFWCGDITYLPTANGWVYLATVKDLFSRRILGWAVDDSLEATLVATAWQRALKTRGFAALQGPELYHSDRGSQYCGDVVSELPWKPRHATQHECKRRVLG